MTTSVWQQVIPLSETDMEALMKRPDLNKEVGTELDAFDLPFGDWDNGAVMDLQEPAVEDMQDALDSDGKLAQLFEALSLPLRSVEWKLVPGDDKDTGEASEWVDHVLRRPANAGGMSTPFDRVIAQQTTALAYRKTYHEKVFMPDPEDPKRIVYAKLAWRPPATCELLRDRKSGAFRGFRQQSPTWISDTGVEASKDGYVYIPPMYASVFIANQHRDPIHGRSSLKTAYWCFETKKKIRYLWYKFLQGQAIPRLVALGKTDEVKKAAAILAGLGNAGVAGIPRTMADEIIPIDVSGQGADQFLAALRWLDSEMSGSILASFTELGAAAKNGAGSYALSKDQTDFFLQQETGYAREISTHNTNFLVADLVRWNFGPKAAVPKFEIGPLNPEDVSAAFEMLKGIATMPEQLPTDFVVFLVETVAREMGMNPDRLKATLDDFTAKMTASAETPQEEQIAQVAGPVEGLSQIVGEVMQ